MKSIWINWTVSNSGIWDYHDSSGHQACSQYSQNISHHDIYEYSLQCLQWYGETSQPVSSISMLFQMSPHMGNQNKSLCNRMPETSISGYFCIKMSSCLYRNPHHDWDIMISWASNWFWYWWNDTFILGTHRGCSNIWIKSKWFLIF